MQEPFLFAEGDGMTHWTDRHYPDPAEEARREEIAAMRGFALALCTALAMIVICAGALAYCAGAR